MMSILLSVEFITNIHGIYIALGRPLFLTKCDRDFKNIIGKLFLC